MSFKEEKRELIKRYMLEKIRLDDAEFIQKTTYNFQISVTTVKRYIQECLEKQIILQDDDCKSGYCLQKTVHSFEYSVDDGVCEDSIYFEDIAPLMKDISEEAKHIWSYAFMEMMNNAIEHSGCKHIYCRLVKDALYTEITITDDGIGIFKKVQNYLESELGRKVTYQDVLTELYKGKLTTASENHSGEGIFFSSKTMDEFAIWSDNTVYVQGVAERTQFVESHLIAYYTRLKHIWTAVMMKLDNQTRRKIGEVFDMFAPIDEGFIKTRIPIKEVCTGGQPMARSQARKILWRLEQFKQVEFDFAEIDFMGQGFADEVFRVFKSHHPQVEIIPINACSRVLGMIKHVQR